MRNLLALLFGDLLALLDINLSTLPVGIVDISADLLGNLFAIFFVNSFTLRMRNLLALLFGDLLALLLLNDMTILRRNMLTHLFINKVTDLLSDNITFGLSTFRTLFLLDWSTCLLKPSTALLVIFCGAILFVDSFINGSWDTYTKQLWDVVTLFIFNSVALLLGVLCRFTLLGKLCPTLLAISRTLFRS